MADDRTYLTPASETWMKKMPSSAAVRVGDLLFLSGQASVDDNGKPVDTDDVKKQAQNAFARIRKVLKAAGSSMDDVLDVMSFHKDPRTMDAVFDVGRKVFSAPYPAWTPLGMVGAYDPSLDVVIRVIAHVGAGQKKSVTPKSFGWMKGLPLSAACRKGDYMFTSGIVAAGNDGSVVAPSDHMAQARFCYDRLKDVMAAAGGSFDNIVDMICFNHDARGMDPAVDTWCNETVEGLPVNQATSYTAIAMTGLHRLGQVGCYRAIADFSEGPRVAKNLPSVHWHKQRIAGASKQKGGRLIGISGQVASDGQQNIIARGDTASQARYCFSQIRGVLEKHGAGLDDIVEIISFHKDPRAWEIVMGVGKELFDSRRSPAWTPVGCTGLYLEGYLHEIYAIAMV
jgi:enamine deaminase RidA (YjgF/YER057c/UK114 family)